MIRSGIFEGWNWDTHPVYFGYAAVLIAALWLVWRLLLSVERLSGKVKPPTPGQGGEGQDDSAEGQAEPPSEG